MSLLSGMHKVGYRLPFVSTIIDMLHAFTIELSLQVALAEPLSDPLT